MASALSSLSAVAASGGVHYVPEVASLALRLGAPYPLASAVLLMAAREISTLEYLWAMDRMDRIGENQTHESTSEEGVERVEKERSSNASVAKVLDRRSDAALAVANARVRRIFNLLWYVGVLTTVLTTASKVSPYAVPIAALVQLCFHYDGFR